MSLLDHPNLMIEVVLVSVTAVQRAADVDSRALRFQETVDRSPMFFGKEAESIAAPVLRKYNDVHND